MTDDHSQENIPSVDNQPNTIIAGVPQPQPPLQLVPDLPPSKPHLQIVPRLSPSPTTIPGGAWIFRVGGRIVPYVSMAITANDLVILVSDAYEWYGEQNRESSGQTGDFDFPVQPSPTPYEPSTASTDPVGDPNPVDTVVRDQVREALGDSNTGSRPAGQPAEIDLDQEIARIERARQEANEADERSRQQWLGEQEAAQIRRDRDAAENWRKPLPTTESNPDTEIPTTINDPNWMRPAENPNGLPEVPSLPSIPGLNLDEPLQRPRISGDRSTFQPRATQEAAEPANSDPPNSTENSDQADRTPPAEEGNSGEPASRQQRRQEAKKRKIEEAVVGQDLQNLPENLRIKMRDIGYVITGGENRSIRYIGKLPSGNQLHLEKKDGIWTIQPGPSPTNTRLSNQNEAKKNVLEGTGVKNVPEGYENNHITPDEVWKNDPLLRQYDKNNGEAGVDKARNLILMPKNKTAAINGRENPDVQTLEEKGRLLNNVNHRGSHGKWNKHVADTYKEEREKLELEYGSLENVPKEILKETVEGIQDGLMNELREVDRKIERGDVNNLPEWIKDDGNNNPGGTPEHRLSNIPSILDNQQLAVALKRAVCAKTKEVIAANTHSLELSAISKDILNQAPTHKDLYQLLGVITLNSFKGNDANTIATSHYQMERLDAKNIVITGLPDGKKLAVVNTRENTIAMHGKPSPAQLEFLENKLEQAKVALPAETVQNATQNRSNQNQRTM